MGNTPEKPNNKCELFGPFGFFVQFSLGVVSFGTLIIKRQLEYPKRSLRIWLLDVSKQGISTFLLHFLNLFYHSPYHWYPLLTFLHLIQ